MALELNKLEQHDGACRIYLVFENGTAARLELLELDLVLFGTDGVISKRVAVDLSPVRPRKTSVKLFDVDGLACADVDRVLLNDVIACEDERGKRDDCIRDIETTARTGAGVSFIK